jgi:hypothetical protein
MSLGIMYAQFWMHFDVDSFFFLHLGIISKHYCQSKNVKPLVLEIRKPLNANILGL